MRVLVDTSIIPAFLAGQDDRIQEIVRGVERREINGYINSLVVDSGRSRVFTLSYGAKR